MPQFDVKLAVLLGKPGSLKRYNAGDVADLTDEVAALPNTQALVTAGVLVPREVAPVTKPASKPASTDK